MKTRLVQSLSILLAAMLQIAPLVRSLLPATNGLAPSTWAIVLKIGVGTMALLGFDAVSQASSIAISPANAVVGTPYNGTVSYSGGHAGAVTSMMMSNNCLSSSYSIGNGLTIIYTGGNKATVSGTPTAANTNETFTVQVWQNGCGSGHSDTRSTALVVSPGGGSAVAPSISAAPQNILAQVGTEADLSGGASGNPIPQYQWWQNGVAIPGATNSILSITNVQLTSSGIYTMTASNSQNVGQSFAFLPKASCYLSACVTPGTNITTLNYTNFVSAGVPLTMSCLLTNVGTATNFYTWYLNYGAQVISTSNTLQFTAAQVAPAKSGIYTVRFDSTNASGYIVTNQQYDSYWCFGYLPMFTNQLPASTNVTSGSSVTFNVGVQGSLDAYYPAGFTGYAINSGVPNVFWYQGSSLVASQSLVLEPTSGTTYSNTAATAGLTLNNVTSANSGNYTVVVTNFWGSITSSAVNLTVPAAGYAPGFTVQPPTALNLLAGQSSAISVTVTGTPPIAYQWLRNGSTLANGGAYGGVATNTLSLTSVGAGNAGNFSVAVTNSIGAVTSSVTVLNVSTPPSVAAKLGGSGIQLSGSTVTDLTYVVQSATNLASPTWVPILTNNTGAGGNISFQTNTTAKPSTFYRLIFP